MDVWILVLYGVASFLALRSLIVLMANHKHEYTEQVQREEAVRRQREMFAAQQQKLNAQADGEESAAA